MRTRMCDYCQQPGARVISDEGFCFHKNCATKYTREQGNIIDQINPSTDFHFIDWPEYRF